MVNTKKQKANAKKQKANAKQQKANKDDVVSFDASENRTLLNALR